VRRSRPLDVGKKRGRAVYKECKEKLETLSCKGFAKERRLGDKEKGDSTPYKARKERKFYALKIARAT